MSATTSATYAPVGSREASTSWGCWLLDGAITAVKGIARNFFPIRSSEPYSIQVAKIAARVSVVSLVVAGCCLFPKAALIGAAGLLVCGLLFKTFSHLV